MFFIEISTETIRIIICTDDSALCDRSEVLIECPVPVTKLFMDEDCVIVGLSDGTMKLYDRETRQYLSQLNVIPVAARGTADNTVGAGSELSRAPAYLQHKISFLARRDDFVIAAMLDPSAAGEAPGVRQLEISIWPLRGLNAVHPLKTKLLPGTINFLHFAERSGVLYALTQYGSSGGANGASCAASDSGAPSPPQARFAGSSCADRPAHITAFALGGPLVSLSWHPPFKSLALDGLKWRESNDQLQAKLAQEVMEKVLLEPAFFRALFVVEADPEEVDHVVDAMFVCLAGKDTQSNQFVEIAIDAEISLRRHNYQIQHSGGAFSGHSATPAFGSVSSASSTSHAAASTITASTSTESSSNRNSNGTSSPSNSRGSPVLTPHKQQTSSKDGLASAASNSPSHSRPKVAKTSNSTNKDVSGSISQDGKDEGRRKSKASSQPRQTASNSNSTSTQNAGATDDAKIETSASDTADSNQTTDASAQVANLGSEDCGKVASGTSAGLEDSDPVLKPRSLSQKGRPNTATTSSILSGSSGTLIASGSGNTNADGLSGSTPLSPPPTKKKSSTSSSTSSSGGSSSTTKSSSTAASSAGATSTSSSASSDSTPPQYFPTNAMTTAVITTILQDVCAPYLQLVLSKPLGIVAKCSTNLIFSLPSTHAAPEDLPMFTALCKVTASIFDGLIEHQSKLPPPCQKLLVAIHQAVCADNKGDSELRSFRRGAARVFLDYVLLKSWLYPVEAQLMLRVSNEMKHNLRIVAQLLQVICGYSKHKLTDPKLCAVVTEYSTKWRAWLLSKVSEGNSPAHRSPLAERHMSSINSNDPSSRDPYHDNGSDAKARDSKKEKDKRAKIARGTSFIAPRSGNSKSASMVVTKYIITHAHELLEAMNQGKGRTPDPTAIRIRALADSLVMPIMTMMAKQGTKNTQLAASLRVFGNKAHTIYGVPSESSRSSGGNTSSSESVSSESYGQGMNASGSKVGRTRSGRKLKLELGTIDGSNSESGEIDPLASPRKSRKVVTQKSSATTSSVEKFGSSESGKSLLASDSESTKGSAITTTGESSTGDLPTTKSPSKIRDPSKKSKKTKKRLETATTTSASASVSSSSVPEESTDPGSDYTGPAFISNNSSANGEHDIVDSTQLQRPRRLTDGVKIIHLDVEALKSIPPLRTASRDASPIKCTTHMIYTPKASNFELEDPVQDVASDENTVLVPKSKIMPRQDHSTPPPSHPLPPKPHSIVSAAIATFSVPTSTSTSNGASNSASSQNHSSPSRSTTGTNSSKTSGSPIKHP